MTAPLADLEVEDFEDLILARVDGEVDMSNATELGEAIGRALTGDARGLVLDLVAVTYFDSAGIRVIYELRDRVQARGHDLCLAVAPDSPIADALRVSGVLDAIVTRATPEEARAALLAP